MLSNNELGHILWDPTWPLWATWLGRFCCNDVTWKPSIFQKIFKPNFCRFWLNFSSWDTNFSENFFSGDPSFKPKKSVLESLLLKTWAAATAHTYPKFFEYPPGSAGVERNGKTGISLPGNFVIWREKIKKYIWGTIPHWREICPAGGKFFPACWEINIFPGLAPSAALRAENRNWPDSIMGGGGEWVISEKGSCWLDSD